jgi:membrane protein implicated in regulation of membrane protease activity
MKTQIKIWIILIALMASMFYWITRIDTSFKRVISFLIIALLSYWLGRAQGEVILGENRANGMDSGYPNPPKLK